MAEPTLDRSAYYNEGYSDGMRMLPNMSWTGLILYEASLRQAVGVADVALVGAQDYLRGWRDGVEWDETHKRHVALHDAGAWAAAMAAVDKVPVPDGPDLHEIFPVRAYPPMPAPDSDGTYTVGNGCRIYPAFDSPGKWGACWSNRVPLRGECLQTGQEVNWLFNSAEEAFHAIVDGGGLIPPPPAD